MPARTKNTIWKTEETFKAHGGETLLLAPLFTFGIKKVVFANAEKGSWWGGDWVEKKEEEERGGGRRGRVGRGETLFSFFSFFHFSNSFFSFFLFNSFFYLLFSLYLSLFCFLICLSRGIYPKKSVLKMLVFFFKRASTDPSRNTDQGV